MFDCQSVDMCTLNSKSYQELFESLKIVGNINFDLEEMKALCKDSLWGVLNRAWKRGRPPKWSRVEVGFARLKVE